MACAPKYAHVKLKERGAGRRARWLGAVVAGGKDRQARVGRHESAEKAVDVGIGYRRGGILCGSRRGIFAC